MTRMAQVAGVTYAVPDLATADELLARLRVLRHAPHHHRHRECTRRETDALLEIRLALMRERT